MSVREAQRELNKLTRRRKFLSMRLAGRRIVDLLRFGRGAVERIGSACVLAAVFFFVAAVAGALAGMPPGQCMAVALVAFAAAVVTLMVFVIGPSDDDVRAEVEAMEEPIAEARAGVQVAEREEAEDRELRAEEEEEEEERRPRRGRVLGDWDDDRRERPGRRSTPRCPYCREEIDRNAVKCPHCGEWVDDDYHPRQPQPSKGVSSGIAALLSFLFIGAGQIAQSRVVVGLLWMFGTYALYALSPCSACVTLPIAVFLHVMCIVEAAAHG